MGEYLYNAYCNYFSALQNTGYYPQRGVSSLIIMDFIYELLYGNFRGYLSSDDYYTISKALDCLYGSCLLPYPYRLTNDDLEMSMNNKSTSFTLSGMFMTDKLVKLNATVEALMNAKAIQNKEFIANVPDVDVQKPDED